jgi:nitrogen fixation/metabolism regulation signal transduction histidine kinase
MSDLQHPSAPVDHPILQSCALLAMLTCPALPGPWGLLALLGLIGVWWWCRPRPHQKLLGAPLLAVMALLLAGTAVGELMLSQPELLQRQIDRDYRKLWRKLDRLAARAAARLDLAAAGSSDLLRDFQVLSEMTGGRECGGCSLYVLAPDQQAVAWAGAGLLHDLRPEILPANGRASRASFSAVSALSVRPLGASRPGWRVVAGRTYVVDRFPFGVRWWGWTGERVRWSVEEAGREADDGLLRVSVPQTPTLVVELLETSRNRLGDRRFRPARRLAWLACGLLLLVLAGSISQPLAGPEAAAVPSRGSRGGQAALAAGGMLALALAAAVPAWAVATLLAGLVACALVLSRNPLAGRRGAAAAGPVAGALAATLLLLWGSLVQGRWGMLDLSAAFVGSPEVSGARVALFVLAFGLLAIAGWRESEAAGASGETWGWLGLATLLIAAAWHDTIWVAGPVVVLGGALSGLWCRCSLRPVTVRTLALLGLLAALLAFTCWEITARRTERQELETVVLPALALPTDGEMDALAVDLGRFFAALQIEDFSPVPPAELDRQDLALEVWNHSPLARPGVLSALTVALPNGRTSTFSFGLPMDQEGEVDWNPIRWRGLRFPGWEAAILSGDGVLELGGMPWAPVRYWLALRPGFRLLGERMEDLAAGLLRGGPMATAPAERWLGTASLALYDESGSALFSPWQEAPPLPPELLAGGNGEVVTPEGQATAFAATGPGGIRVLFHPRLQSVAALERVGIGAVGALALVVLLAVAVALPNAGFSGLVAAMRRVWHSYAKRLVLVYSLLLLVPLLLLNVLVVQLLEERLEQEQQEAGQAALESAQQVLGEYVLSLEPGFGFNAALDDQLLIWLSGVVHHEVNLYWKSNVYASSKPELFTAGLLPKRIPGEIFSRLTLLGHQISSRTNTAGAARYLELYGPLSVPGVPQDQTRLFLSIPLLAQQEETASKVASLRRTALMDIVRGTQRIADGEASLSMQPAELELATLVEAIDRMAVKISDGRRQLLREKHVVERMVESITSGVVSLDDGRRVMMANRVAIELLGAELGEEIEATLGRDERLAPLRVWLATVGTQLTQRTMQLEAADGSLREWSLVWVPLPGAGEPSALLVVEDVTEVLRGQRLQAWAEMARLIAHEIKNPLTPIRLSAEHLREVYGRDPQTFESVFEDCTANILRQVAELQDIAGEFSTYSRIPKMELQRGDVAATVQELVDGYATSPPKGVEIVLVRDDNPVVADFDAKLLSRSVRNLIENALQATADGGRLEIRVEGREGRADISVADNGPGVPADLLPRIFDPYFSTHDAGTGLGLAIARRIAEEHGGTIAAHNRSAGGLEVTISLPMVTAG